MGDLDTLMPITIEKLGGIFPKPKLSEKLLSKPPFRFIHDCISNTTAETGFLEGLFEGAELDGKGMKDKGDKIAYLEKAITAICHAKGESIDVRASKIVAGLEPENTNLLLAALGECAKDKSRDWAGAVAAGLGGGAGGGAAAAAEAPPAKEVPAPAPSPDHAKGEAKGGGGGAAFEEPAPAKEAPPPQAKAPAPAKAAAAPAPAKAAPAAAGPDLTAEIAACTGNWETTKEMMEPLISKPKMSEKLLTKPPFRFLHDVFTAVEKATGFAAGLYSEEAGETNGKEIKEKQAKIDYLEKMVKTVGFQLGTEVDARAAKIVAGLEAENTNILLQLLALAASRKPDSAAAVEAVLTGQSMPAPAAAAAPAPAPAPAKEPAPAKAPAKGGPQPTPTHARKGDAVHFDGDDDEGPPAPAAAKAAEEEDVAFGRQDTLPDDADAKGGGGGAAAAAAPPGSKGGDEPDEDAPGPLPGGGGGGPDGGGLAGGPIKRTMRPTTAKRRPPRVRDKLKETEGPGGAGEGAKAGGAAPQVVGLMAEGAPDPAMADSDDEAQDKDGPTLGAQMDPRFAAGGQHGKLVQDILSDQAKAAAEEQAKGAAGGGGGGGGDEKGAEGGGGGGGGIRMGRIKKKGKAGGAAAAARGGGYSEGEVERLRAGVQLLCQSANPLGKCMDYVTEDLTMMSTELERWAADHRRKTEVLEEEQKETEESLQPLRLTLLEVTEQIKEQIQKINGVKANIARNDERIRSLLEMISTSVVG